MSRKHTDINDGTRQNAERGADLNGDNLRISRAFCGSVINAGLRLGFGLVFWLGMGIGLRIVIQTAGQSDKMRINHVIRTDEWRAAAQIRPDMHYVVSQ